RVEIVSETIDDQTMELTANGKTTIYNLVDLLRFTENLDEELERHASVQYFFEQQAIDLKYQKQEFEENGYAQWWSHARKFARLIHKGRGIKETLESLKDIVVGTFSKDTELHEREVWEEHAFHGLMLEKYGTEAKVQKAYETDHLSQARSAMSHEMWAFIND